MEGMRRLKLVLILLLLGWQSSAQTHDLETWLGADLKFELSKRFDLVLGQQLRMDQMTTRFDQYFVEPELRWGRKGFRLSAAYRFAVKNGLPGSTFTRHRYQVNAGYKHELGPMSVATRFRFQQVVNTIRGSENLPNGSDRMTFRQKLSVSYSKPKKAQPFIQCEYFIPLGVSESTISTMRYRAGTDIDLPKKQELTLFYTLEHVRDSQQPEYYHTIGIMYSISPKFPKKKESKKKD